MCVCVCVYTCVCGNGCFGTWSLKCLPTMPEEGANRQQKLSRDDWHPLRPILRINFWYQYTQQPHI